MENNHQQLQRQKLRACIVRPINRLQTLHVTPVPLCSLVWPVRMSSGTVYWNSGLSSPGPPGPCIWPWKNTRIEINDLRLLSVGRGLCGSRMKGTASLRSHILNGNLADHIYLNLCWFYGVRSVSEWMNVHRRNHRCILGFIYKWLNMNG